MTRLEYMKLLEYRLEALDPEARSDFLQELSSHIDDLRATHPGESEEDTILRLDSPEFVAEGHPFGVHTNIRLPGPCRGGDSRVLRWNPGPFRTQ